MESIKTQQKHKIKSPYKIIRKLKKYSNLIKDKMQNIIKWLSPNRCNNNKRRRRRRKKKRKRRRNDILLNMFFLIQSDL